MADFKIIVARSRFGGYIISEKPCYKHERWVERIQSQQTSCYCCIIFRKWYWLQAIERSCEPSCKCSPGYLWQLAKNAVLRQQRFFQSLPARVSDYVINNDSCDDSQPSLTIALPAWSALQLSIETFVFCLKKEAVLREERKTLKPSRLWAIAIVTGYLITANLKIALTI